MDESVLTPELLRQMLAYTPDSTEVMHSNIKLFNSYWPAHQILEENIIYLSFSITLKCHLVTVSVDMLSFTVFLQTDEVEDLSFNLQV